MNRSIVAKIFAIFLVGWAASALLLVWLVATIAPAFSRHYEHEIYARVAPELARQIALAPQEGRTTLDLMRSLRAVSPDLDSYVLDSSGRITEALDAALKGKQLPLSPLLLGLSQEHPNLWRCGIDPNGKLPCPAFSIARVIKDGRESYLYVVALHGPTVFFEGRQGKFFIGRHLIPGLSIALIASLLLALIVVRTFAKDLLEISALLRAFSNLDFSRRFSVRSRDDTALVGGAINTMADTLEYRMRELRAAASTRRRLLAKVVHDFRRPLSVMSVLLERAPKLLTRGDPEEQAKFTTKLTSALQSERAILQSLKPLYESPSGESLAKEESFSLPTLVQELAHELLPLFQKRCVSLTCSTQEIAPDVIGNRGELLRAFLNLLDNALHYTARGGSVSVRIFSDNGLAVVEIQDSGIGISEQDLQRIFDPFERAALAIEMNPSGTGLGLATVKEIVEGHGGSLVVSSQPNQGTLIRVVLATTTNRLVPPDARRSSRSTELPTELRSAPLRPIRSYYAFESIALLLLLAEIAFAGTTSLTTRHSGWLPQILISIALLFATRCALGRGHLAHKSQQLILFVRFVALFGFAVLWSIGAPDLLDGRITSATLLNILSQGILLGLAFSGRPFLLEAVPALLPLLVGSTLYLRVIRESSGSSIPVALLIFATICAFLIGIQANRRGYRRYSLRLLGVLYGLFHLGLLPHLYVFDRDRHQLLFHSIPLLHPAYARNLAAEFGKIGVNTDDPELDPSMLQEKAYRIGSLNPRLDISVFCDGPGLCARSPLNQELAFDEASVQSLRALAQAVTPFESMHRNGVVFSAFPVPGHPGAQALVSAESRISDKTIVRTSQFSIALFFLGGTILSLLNAALILFSCFESIRRRIKKVVAAVDSVREGRSIRLDASSKGDELDRMIYDIATLQTQIETVSSALAEERRETRDVVEKASLTLEHGLAKVQAALGTSPDSVAVMTIENERAAAIVQEVFRYSLLLAAEKVAPPSERTLAEIVERAIADAPTVANLSASVAIEDDPLRRTVICREEFATPGIELLLRSLLDEQDALSNPDERISLRYAFADLSGTDKEARPVVRILAPLRISVSPERDLLYLLGEKILKLGGIRVTAEERAEQRFREILVTFPKASDAHEDNVL